MVGGFFTTAGGKVSAYIAQWTTHALEANFSTEPESGFVPLTVNFNDLSTPYPAHGNIVTWFWLFGDDSISAQQNPIHTYLDTGLYDVTLIVSDTVESDTMTKLRYIGVFDTLTVDFSGQPTHGRKPLTVSFQSFCSLTPDSVTWYFGDGETSNDLNPVHQYTGGGGYDVKLLAELWGYKDSLTKQDYIQVSDIKAEFAADPRCGAHPLQVTFSDGSTGTYPITNWHWDFGDGDTSNQKNPIHQFQNTGIFDVTLIVSDGIGVDTLIKEDYVIVQDLSADFFGVPVSGRPPLTVMFEPHITGMVNQYFWDFGDGQTDTLRNPIHTYSIQGKYDVKLKARLELEGCNQVDSVIKEDYVVALDLDAQFSANPEAGVAPLQVQFSDESSGEPTSWFWWFGDGGYSYEQNPVHEYQWFGRYPVFLRVTNALGQVDSLLKLSYIFVDEAGYVKLWFELGRDAARPGYYMEWFPTYQNYGTKAARDCVIKMLLPPQIQFSELIPYCYHTGSYSGYSLSADTFVVPMGTIQPSEWPGGALLFYCYVPTNVPVGTTLIGKTWFSTSTTPFYGKTYDEIERVVTGSWDPNDKLADPEGKGTIHAIEPDRRLTYTIQFENKPEATAEAIYIVVVDTLDQDLDWGTLGMLMSSHPDKCHYEFDPYTGVITWFCDSIMLPPNQNPPEGEGYFTFSISPDSGLAEGTQIANSAWIRFDYNPWMRAPEEGPVIRTIHYFIRGDVNDDGVIDISDIVYLLNYLFINGPAPDPLWLGDATCEGVIDASDLVYLLNYLFAHGPAPCK
jgi:PKD repeat protein